MHFLFPSHPLRRPVIDEMFADQRSAAIDAGFTSSLCPESSLRDGRPLMNIPAGATVVYRGWMLNAPDYEALTRAVAAAGGVPLTSPATYLATHHLPNWYPLIAEFTPETRVFPESEALESQLRELGWEAFFVKDYVKSLKTSRGSIVRDPSEIGPLVTEMRTFRGEIEGGVCVRRVEALLPETERRYFVIDGRAYAPTDEQVPELVQAVAQRIPSRFFSVDVSRRADGVLRVVEIGDGQVSDLVGWSAERFYDLWKSDADS